MKRLLASLLVLGLLAASASSQPPASLKIHMIGHGEYGPEQSLPLLKMRLEDRYRVQCTMSLKLDKKGLDNFDALKSADVLVIFARRMNLPPDQMDVIRGHWEKGKPIVALRTASHAFQKDDNEVFDKQVLGGSYSGTGGKKAVVAATAADHPVLKGVGPFEPSVALFGQGKMADDVVVLQVKGSAPMTWTHDYKGGRIVYTAAGGPGDFANENFLRLLENSVFWTAKLNPEAMKK